MSAGTMSGNTLAIAWIRLYSTMALTKSKSYAMSLALKRPQR